MHRRLIFVPLEMIDLSPPAAPKLLVSRSLMEIYLCKKGKVISLMEIIIMERIIKMERITIMERIIMEL